MNLHEEFKLFEDMWDEDEVPATSSVQIILNGEKILDKKRVPHIEAYEALIKTLQSITNEDLTALRIHWIPEDADGRDSYDPIITVPSFQELIDSGEDIESAASEGYDFRRPANRLVVPDSYSTDDLGLPYSVYDEVEELLTSKVARSSPVYIARFRDNPASVFYEGSKQDCQKAANVIASSSFAKTRGGVVVHHKGQAHS